MTAKRKKKQCRCGCGKKLNDCEIGLQNERLNREMDFKYIQNTPLFICVKPRMVAQEMTDIWCSADEGIRWFELARWHLSELKKAELRASIEWLVWSKDPTEGESVDPYVALEDKIKVLQSELRKMEEEKV